jgi:hypothetical protein
MRERVRRQHRSSAMTSRMGGALDASARSMALRFPTYRSRFRARTGRRSSQMVNRWRRIAMSFTDLNRGDLAPPAPTIPSWPSSPC